MKLPSGVDLTLSELQEMATRQQQQIEAQQQQLVAKEQRLKFLKQQELRHQQIASENERLRKLREKVEAQELKLKKLRALRGQVSEHKSNNNNLSAELETIKALFNEKEKELSVAVNKVEHLTHQLTDLRNGQFNNRDNKHNMQATLELEKLRKELVMRNKLNEQQNSKLAAHREVMLQRKDEMAHMDQRIAELQARLRKKRSQEQKETIYNNLANQQRTTYNNNNNANAKLGTRPLSSANIAAVEPYIKHAPKEMTKLEEHHDTKSFILSKQDPKYQTLPYSIKFPSSDGGKKLEGDVNSNVYLASEKRLMKGDYGKIANELRVDPIMGKGGKDLPSLVGKQTSIDYLPKETLSGKQDYKPSLGHTIAFEAMEDTLKQAKKEPPPVQQKPKFGLGYKPPTTLGNFTPRPFGTTYSTAMLGNRGSPVTTSASSPFINDSISGPGIGFPKTSTPIAAGNNNNDMKEIFITGAPSVAAPSRPFTFSQGQRAMDRVPATTTSQPLNVVTSVPSSTPSSSSPNSTTTVTTIYDSRTGQPLYQIATSRPQPPMQPQHTQDLPSPASTSSSSSGKYTHPLTSSGVYDSKSGAAVSQSTLPGNFSADVTSTANTDHNRNYSQSSAYKDEPERHTISHETVHKGDNSPPQHSPTSDQNVLPSSHQSDTHTTQSDQVDKKKDLSPTSVSSALSVLMSGTSNTMQAKPSYRYAPKSVIANTYMRRLGSTALDQYRQNMTQLYQDFITKQSDLPDSPTATVRPMNMSSQQDQPDSKRPPSPQTQTGEDEDSNGSSRQDGPPPYRGVPPHDLDAERLHYRPNAPKLRRRLSSGESDDLRQFQQQKSPLRQFSEDDVFTSDSDKAAVFRTDDVHHNNTNYPNMSTGSTNSTSNHVDQANKSKPNLPNTDRENSNMPMAKRRIKSLLKKKGSFGSSRRVSFDPLALLLDASLEGELELVMRTASEVPDPSAANDEGITALHNAICAGHYEIVKFLVEFGCNVNSPDSDGWTPLHCAASCNNLPMVRLLVEHGACIFATTISDHETAAEKCEEDEDGYDGCSEYLYNVQEKLGIINKGIIYAVFDYSAQNHDELTFRNRDSLTILRKGDENEKDWWWAKLRDAEGYIPRNLLGLYPRVEFKKQSDAGNKNKNS
jgi:hypothetical protein